MRKPNLTFPNEKRLTLPSQRFENNIYNNRNPLDLISKDLYKIRYI